MMKKTIAILSSIILLSGCYDTYIKDFDYCAGYITYQYDLRTFVVGEGMTFKVGVTVAGVSENREDRVFNVTRDNHLLTEDLSAYNPTPATEIASFTALDGLRGSGKLGLLSGGATSYVSAFYTPASITELVPLPEEYYTADFSTMTVKKGDHTASIPVTATDAIISDPKAFSPYYAIGYRIIDAQVDSVLLDKSFSVVGIKCENQYWGNWYHGGSYVIDGETVKYPFSIPQEDIKVYTLRTVDANTVITDKYIQNKGSLKLTFSGDDITITSDDVNLVPDSRRSWSNGAKLLQDRKLYLNYSYIDKDGLKVEVSDSLVFRNRNRDGVNEWQDENPEHYN